MQIMVPYNYTEFIDGLTSLVENKFIPIARINDAVSRILRVKFTMGLFEHPLADYTMSKYLGSQVSFGLRQNLFNKCVGTLTFCKVLTGTQGTSKGSCKEISCPPQEWRIFTQAIDPTP